MKEDLAFVALFAAVIAAFGLFIALISMDDTHEWALIEGTSCVNHIHERNDWFFKERGTTVTKYCEVSDG